MTTNSTHQTVPKFETVEEESDFWDSHSVTEFEAREVDASEVLSELRLSRGKQQITLSLDDDLVERLKSLGAARRRSLSELAGELMREGMKGS